MKKLLWLCHAITFLCGCMKETNQPASDAAKNLVAAELVAADDWVWINNEKMIQVFNPATTSWNGEPIWKWKPEAAKNYSPYAIEKWGNGGTDFKIRNVARWGGNCFAACSVTG